MELRRDADRGPPDRANDGRWRMNGDAVRLNGSKPVDNVSSDSEQIGRQSSSCRMFEIDQAEAEKRRPSP